MAKTIKNSIKTRKIAFIATDGVNENALVQMKKALENAGAVVEIIATKQGALITENGTKLPIDGSLLPSSSVLYNAVFVPSSSNY